MAKIQNYVPQPRLSAQKLSPERLDRETQFEMEREEILWDLPCTD